MNITLTGGNSTSPYTFTYSLNGTNQTVTSVGNVATVAVPNIPSGTYTYSLISVKDASAQTCSQSQSGSAAVVVNPLPTATIAGTTTICQNASAVNITLTGGNSTSPYTFTYSLNGTNQTVTSVGNSVTVVVPNSPAGTYTYSLISVKDASALTCSQNQSGSVAVVVNPLPTATIAGTTTICQNAAAVNITVTGGNSTSPYTFT